MKRILIAGADSYVGTAFERYLLNEFTDEYRVDVLDMRREDCLTGSLAGYDTVILVAGIVHRPDAPAELYYRVNRDLAVATAEKAKADGVPHFVLFSTMSVYGKSVGTITKDSPLHPRDHYGRSRAQAEQAILALEDDTFGVAVLRPPMIYGNGCKGNFNAVVKYVKMLPAFPRVFNRRSALYIENLHPFLRRVADEQLRGIYFPRNTEPMNTTAMAHAIAEELGTPLHISRSMGVVVWLIRPFFRTLRKAFGSLVYTDMGDESLYADVYDNEGSVRRSIHPSI